MDQQKSFHILTIGNFPLLVRNLWDRIAAGGGYRMSHIAHPSFDAGTWPENLRSNDVHFFVDDIRLQLPMPQGDPEFLASLERDSVPTIHNMIMSDRFISKLPYRLAISYATFLAQRFVSLYEKINPTVIIGSFDSLHNSLGFAVANHMRIPWFTPLYSPLPGDEAAFCFDLSPASRVNFEPQRASALRPRAEKLLADFEARKLAATAYVPPKLFSAAFIFGQIPAQARAFMRVLRARRLRSFLQFTSPAKSYSIRGLIGEAFRLRKNLWFLNRRPLRARPPEGRFVFFGLHMQPESSIDVFAHFFSNQERVIELMARSIPPTHTLLVKLHKSDTHNYSQSQLTKFSRFPGVELVSPYADTIEFLKKADLIFAIQGTIGLEGALLGKPVIMFGDSPSKIFPSVSTVGKTIDLPALVRGKLAEPAPNRLDIIDAFAAYLAPFHPAAHNDWSITPSDSQISDFVGLIELLRIQRISQHSKEECLRSR